MMKKSKQSKATLRAKRRYRLKNRQVLRGYNKKYYLENKEEILNKRREKYQEQLETREGYAKKLLKLSKAKAKANNLPFTITESDVLASMVKICKYTGRDIDYTPNKGKAIDDSPTIMLKYYPDGYIPNNIVVVSLSGYTSKIFGNKREMFVTSDLKKYNMEPQDVDLDGLEEKKSLERETVFLTSSSITFEPSTSDDEIPF